MKALWSAQYEGMTIVVEAEASTLGRYRQQLRVGDRVVDTKHNHHVWPRLEGRHTAGRTSHHLKAKIHFAGLNDERVELTVDGTPVPMTRLR